MTINWNNMQRLSATGSFMMPKLEITVDQSEMLVEVIQDEIKRYGKQYPKQFKDLLDIIATGRKTAKGDYDLSIGDYEMTIKMRLHNLRCCEDLLANSKYEFGFLHRQFEDACEYYKATPACIEKYKKNLRC